MPQQVRDAKPDVLRRAQPEQRLRSLVEPDDLGARAEHDRAVRERSGRGLELRDDAGEALLALAMAALLIDQAFEDAAPKPAHFRKVDPLGVVDPFAQAAQIAHLLEDVKRKAAGDAPCGLVEERADQITERELPAELEELLPPGRRGDGRIDRLIRWLLRGKRTQIFSENR